MGIYLRYYFKKDLKKTLLITFLVSLFFELTQLTSLYGIYNAPYRIFDLDDLILNTFGGFLGYLIVPLFTYYIHYIYSNLFMESITVFTYFIVLVYLNNGKTIGKFFDVFSVKIKLI